jgi:transcriptional regulator with XRE-family HTH domain
MPKKADQPTGFAHRLKALREAAGLTQEQLAERTGLYKFSIAKLEQGVQEPSWPTVLALAKALGVDCRAFVPSGEMAEPRRGRGRPPRARQEAEQGTVPEAETGVNTDEATTGKGRRSRRKKDQGPKG